MSFQISLAIALVPLAVVAALGDVRAEVECMAPQECGDSLLSVSLARTSKQALASDNRASEAELSLMQHLAKSHKATNDLVASFRKLAEDVVEGHKNASDACIQAVQPIWHEMEIVKEGIVNTTALDQKRIDDSLAGVVTCNTVALTGSHTDSSSVSTARETHATCRTQEKELSQDKTTLCQDFENYQADLIFPSCSCDAVTGSASCMLAMASWSQNHNATFFHKKDACDQATEENSAKKTICDDDQERFEMSYCVWASTLDQADEYHTTCYSTATAAYSSAVTDVEADTAIRKAEYDAAVQTQCIVSILTGSDALLDKQTKYAECLNTETDTSMLDITYHDVPAKESISLPASRPCDAVWLQDEYQTHPWHDATKTCFACEASSPEGCTANTYYNNDNQVPTCGCDSSVLSAGTQFCLNGETLTVESSWDTSNCGGASINLASPVNSAWNIGDTITVGSCPMPYVWIKSATNHRVCDDPSNIRRFHGVGKSLQECKNQCASEADCQAIYGALGFGDGSCWTFPGTCSETEHQHSYWVWHYKVCLTVQGSHAGLNGEYSYEGSSSYYVRSDGTMVIRQGDGGWNFCSAAAGAVTQTCSGSVGRQGYVNDNAGMPANSEVYDWGNHMDSTVSYGCSA